MVRRNALMWAAGRITPARSGARQGRRRHQRALARDRCAGARVPRSGGPNSPFPRRLDGADVRRRQGAIDAARALADLGRQSESRRAAADRRAAQARGDAQCRQRRRHQRRSVFAIINVHYDLAAVLLEKGANPNVLDLAGYGARLYAAADMNSLQWGAGTAGANTQRQARRRGQSFDCCCRKAPDPNARLKTRPLKRHHDAGSTLNFGEGHHAVDACGTHRRCGRAEGAARRRRQPFLTLTDGTNALLLAAGQGYGGVRGDGIRIVVPTPEDAAGSVQLLLDRGVDIDSFNTAGNTALLAAINRGDAVVKVLASRHARLIKNKAGVTPLDLATGGGRGGPRRRRTRCRRPRPRRSSSSRESTLAILRQYYPEAAKPN
jgi:hypothetical protein